MINIDVLNSFLKDIFINLCIFYVYIRIINCKSIKIEKVIWVIIYSLLLAILYSNLLIYLNFTFTNILCLLLYTFFISYITKTNISNTIFIMVLSTAITFSLFILSSIISGIIFKVIFRSMSDNNPIGIFMIIITETIFIWRIFKANRLKNGFSFIKKDNDINNISICGMLCAGISIIIYSFIGVNASAKFNQNLYAGSLLIMVGIIVWVKKQITLTYKQMLKEDTIIQLENELAEEKMKNKKAIEEIENLAKINHKYSTRISATESYIKNIIKNMNYETSEELIKAEKLVNNLEKEYVGELEDIRNIQKTNNIGIDNIINYLQKESNKNDIEFIFKNNVKIDNLTSNNISQSSLETLLADHIKDAIIAINASNSKNKSIKIILEKIEDVYELSIYDTGVEFEIETLLKLGKERVTTHGQEGGSGIGFMTTFETLKECKASLIIEEYNERTTNYTKSVTIRFDKKNEYKILSYRADQIKKQTKDNRIIVEEI